MSAASAKSRLLAATLSCTIGFGLLSASAVGYWYAKTERVRRADALLAAAERGARLVEERANGLARDARRAAREIMQIEAGRGPSYALHRLRALYEANWILLADPSGKVLATSHEAAGFERILGLGGVRDALAGETTARLWIFPEQSWLVALAPIGEGEDCRGLALLGLALDERFAQDLAVASGAGVWLRLGQSVVLSDAQHANLPGQYSNARSDGASSLIASGGLDVLSIDRGDLATESAFVDRGGTVGYYELEEHTADVPWWHLALLGLLGVFAGLVNWQRLAASFSRVLDRLTYAFFEVGEGRLEVDLECAGCERYFADLVVAYRRMQHQTRQRMERLTEAAEHSEQAIQAKDKFLASISHELRTPLTSVRAYAELLLQFSQDGRSEEETEFLNIIQDESTRLTRLIDDVLYLTRIEARTLTWQVTSFDLRELVQSLLVDLDSKINFKSLTIDYEPGYDSVRYNGDRRRIGQALTHVLDNAIKFSPVGGRVRIEISQKLTSLEIRVEDGGPGVPGAAEKAAIFEKFHQRGEALTDRPEGTGLGLALTREILEAHAGTIFCEDADLGGAAFVIRIAKVGETRRAVDAGHNLDAVDAFMPWTGV